MQSAANKACSVAANAQSVCRIWGSRWPSFVTEPFCRRNQAPSRSMASTLVASSIPAPSTRAPSQLRFAHGSSVSPGWQVCGERGAGQNPAIHLCSSSRECAPRDRGRPARFNTPVGLRPTCGRDARAPRGRPLRSALSPGPRASRPLQHTGGPSAHLRARRPRSQGTPAPLGAFPGTAGVSPASTHRWAFGPLAGGTPAIPGTTAPLGAFPGIAGVPPA